MKNKKFLCGAVLALFAIVSLSSCNSYTNVQGITDAPIGSKVGTSSQLSIFGIGVGGPRQSIVSAAADARIEKITHVEEYNKSYGGVVRRHTIRVYGE